MRVLTRRLVAALIAMLALCGAANWSMADELPLGAPPPSPMTLWNFLGIPQGMNQVRDATLNRRGNNPQRERVNPLKRLADPENMESKNPAIQAAAKIKADADLAPQKIKALKYLATVGCCCNSQKDMVKAALLGALDDCTEAVRYEAAVALCQVAGDRCAVCRTCSCCSADVMNKLNELANGQDEKGCWTEPSCRVRQAASAALNSCRSFRQPEGGESPVPPTGLPPEQRNTSPVPVTPVPAPKAPSPAPVKNAGTAVPVDQSVRNSAESKSGPSLISASDEAGYAIISHAPEARPVKASSKPSKAIPVNAEGLKIITPDVSRPAVKLVEHVAPAQADISTISVPTPVWSKPVPVRHSIVTVQ